MSTVNEQLKDVINLLKTAVRAKDKKAICDAYDTANTLDLERASDDVFDEYDALCTKANDILLD